MSSITVDTLILLTALGSGLTAGIFYAFSTFVMAALARLAPAQGISAMQSINITVINPWFLGAFFGTALGSIFVAVFAILNWDTVGVFYLADGAALYLVGSILVTMFCNVPLNNALAAVEPDSAGGAELWTRYRSNWTFWNHVRTAASLAAAGCFVMALRG